MSRFFDKKGQPISLYKFGELFEDKDYRFILHEHIKGYRISTIWLGADRSDIDGGKDISIFESKVFDSKDEVDQRRYPTLEKAILGHKELVDRYR